MLRVPTSPSERVPSIKTADHLFRRNSDEELPRSARSALTGTQHSARRGGMHFSKGRSEDFHTSNAEDASMIEKKKELLKMESRRKLEGVKTMRRMSLAKKNGEPWPEAVDVPTTFKFALSRAEQLSSRNAETEEMIDKKMEERRKEEEELHEKVAAMRLGIQKETPKMKFEKNPLEEYRTRNALSPEELEVLREERQRERELQMDKVRKLKAWEKGIVDGGEVFSPRSGLKTQRDYAEDFRTRNADTERDIELKKKLLETDRVEIRKKVMTRREQVKLRRSSLVKTHIHEVDRRILGQSRSKDPASAMLACKHYAIKVKEVADTNQGKKSLTLMKNRMEGWETRNADTPEILEEKRRRNMEEEELRRKRVQQLKEQRDKAAKQRIHNLSSPRARSPPARIVRVMPDRAKAFETMNADDDDILQLKREAQAREERAKLQKVQERRREARDHKNLVRSQIRAALSTKNITPQMKDVYERSLSPKASRSSPRARNPMLPLSKKLGFRNPSSPAKKRSNSSTRHGNTLALQPENVRRSAETISPKSAPPLSPRLNLSFHKKSRNIKSKTAKHPERKKFVWGLKPGKAHSPLLSGRTRSGPSVRRKKGRVVGKPSSKIRMSPKQLDDVEKHQRKFEAWLDSFDF